MLKQKSHISITINKEIPVQKNKNIIEIVVCLPVKNKGFFSIRVISVFEFSDIHPTNLQNKKS
jgi:hypothetical protein